MHMRASKRGASELGKFSHFYILNKLRFPSTFCGYFWYFISETYTFSGLKLHLHTYRPTINAVPCYDLWYGVTRTPLYKRQLQFTDKTLTLRQFMYICERAERASWANFRIFTYFSNYFFQYFVGTSDTFSGQMTCLSAYIYRKISKCTDKSPKKHYWGGGGQLLTITISYQQERTDAINAPESEKCIFKR